MRIFEGRFQADDWSNKWNFIDANNVLVGFDSEHACCEYFGYRFGSVPFGDDASDDAASLEPYVFVRDQEPQSRRVGPVSCGDDEMSFRMVADGKPDLWLTIYNYHEGYYMHGWTFGPKDAAERHGKI